MNRHTLADQLTLLAGRTLSGGRRYFSGSIESPSVTQLASELRVTAALALTPGIHRIAFDAPWEHLDPAYAVLSWRPSHQVTLIHHHGNNERPFDSGRFAKSIFARMFPSPETDLACNVVVVRAPFHDEPAAAHMGHMAELRNFALMVAASAAVTEALVRSLRTRTPARIVVSGISLGGWVTNLHHAVFGTADATVPIFAGSAMAETFLTAAYRHLTSPSALARPAALRDTLSFEQAYLQRGATGAHPLLACHDQFIDFRRQSQSYGDVRMRVMRAGHVTGAANAAFLRDHLLGVLNGLS